MLKDECEHEESHKNGNVLYLEVKRTELINNYIGSVALKCKKILHFEV